MSSIHPIHDFKFNHVARKDTFRLLFGLGMHVLFTSPNPATPKKVGRTIREGLFDAFILTTFIPKNACWIHAVIELMIILAAAVPNSIVAESILTFLLPHKDPTRIFLSPMGFIATILNNHKLITSGPYSYVRHPSYTGAYLCFAGTIIWYTAQGSWLRESEIYKKPLAWLVIAPVTAYFLMVALTLFRRMRKEDEMLKNTFGEEWVEWARQVPDQFFPGIY